MPCGEIPSFYQFASVVEAGKMLLASNHDAILMILSVTATNM